MPGSQPVKKFFPKNFTPGKAPFDPLFPPPGGPFDLP